MKPPTGSMIPSAKSATNPTNLLTSSPGCLFILLMMVLMGPWRPADLYAQNIYDEQHSREFARYLMQSNQFSLASAEWERVLFLSPSDTTARLNLIKSLRLSGKPDEGWDKLNRWYPEAPLTRSFSLEAAQLALVRGDYARLDGLLSRSAGLSEAEKSTLRLGAWLLEGSWSDLPAGERKPPFTVASMNPKLLDLYNRTQDLQRKSPGLAVTLSAVVPGLGKVYASDWKDGLMSFLFVATSAFQSYRGFSKNGVSSVTGWIFGGLAAGFYTANLFGSWKSAGIYNDKQLHLIQHEAEGILISR